MSVVGYSDVPRFCTDVIMEYLQPAESEKTQVEEAVCGNLVQANERFHLYAGKHCTVFSYVEEPGIIKCMRTKEALDSKKCLDVVRKVFAERQFRYCYAPSAHLVNLSDKKTLFIMDKATGETDPDIAQEMMEQEFERIPIDPVIAEKWKTMTREVAEAVAATGYWDSQRKNFVWDPKLGFAFIDFERVTPNLFLKQTGLSRLPEIFPPEYVDVIYNVAEEEGVPLNIGRDAAKIARKNQFELSRECSRWDKQKAFPRVLEKDKWPASSKERKILDKFDESRNQPWYKNNRPRQTKLFWQPFSNAIPWDKQDDAATLEQHKKERQEFEAALKNLQNAGDLLTWKVNENRHQTQLVEYSIYF